MVICSQKRKKDAIWLWLRNYKNKKTEEKMTIKILNKMMSTKAGRIKEALEKIKSIPDNKKSSKYGRMANRF